MTISFKYTYFAYAHYTHTLTCTGACIFLKLKKNKGRSPSPPPPQRAMSQTPASGRQTPMGQRPPSPKPPAIRRTPSPNSRTPREPNSPTMRRRTPSPKYYRSYSDDSNVADSIKSELVDDFDLGATGNSKYISVLPTVLKHVWNNMPSWLNLSNDIPSGIHQGFNFAYNIEYW